MVETSNVFQQLIYQHLRSQLKDVEDSSDDHETSHSEDTSIHCRENNIHQTTCADKRTIECSEPQLINRNECICESLKFSEYINIESHSALKELNSEKGYKNCFNLGSHNWRKLMNNAEPQIYTFVQHFIKLMENPEWKWMHPVRETRRIILNKLHDALETCCNDQIQFSKLNTEPHTLIPACYLIDSIIAYYPKTEFRSKKKLSAKAYDEYIRNVIDSVSNSKWNFKKAGEFLNRHFHSNLKISADFDYRKEDYMKTVIRTVNNSQFALIFPVAFSMKVDALKEKDEDGFKSRNLILQLFHFIGTFRKNWESSSPVSSKFEIMGKIKLETVNYINTVVETVDRSQFDLMCAFQADARETRIITVHENETNTNKIFGNLSSYLNHFPLSRLFQNEKQSQKEIMMKYLERINNCSRMSNLYLTFPVELKSKKLKSKLNNQNIETNSYIKDVISEVASAKVNLKQGLKYPMNYRYSKVRRERNKDDEMQVRSSRSSIKGPPISDKFMTKAEIFIRLTAGAVAATVSRTIIAPFEYTRGYFFRTKKPYNFMDAFIFISKTKHEGYRRYWKGHSLTIVSVVPELAVRFVVHDQCKLLLDVQNTRSTPRRMLAGSIAGVVGQTVVYPLEVIRLRYVVVRRGTTTYWKTAKLLWSEAGLRSLYRGFLANLLTVIPFVSVSFFSYDFLKRKYRSVVRKPKSSSMRLLCGMAAGCLGQLAASPFHPVRRKMQFTPYGTEIYRNTWVTFLAMLREDVKGSIGRWRRMRSIALNSFRGPVVVGLSFAIYDYLLDKMMIKSLQ